MKATTDDSAAMRGANDRSIRTHAMAGLFAVVAEVLEDGIKVTVKSMIADEDYVVVEGKGKARSKSGLDYNNDYCLVFEVHNSKIQHVRQYLDSELVNRVFGRG